MWITEDFLHFVWKYQKFNRKHLETTDGENITVYHQGYHNHDGGPDFEEARINIGDVQWCGQVEIHINASDWYRHGHQHDEKYENVILHVVWKADKDVYYRNAQDQHIPVVELQPLIPVAMINACRQLMSQPDQLACSGKFEQINRLKKITQLDRMVVRRLQRKAEDVLQLLHYCRGNWQQTTFVWLARQYGFKLNTEAMMQLAYAIPVNALLKHREQLLQLEALLFGVSGLLQEHDAYTKCLNEEFKFLNAKYQLEDHVMRRRQWKFMRTRPANFPTVRIAQLAALLHCHADFLHVLMTESATGVLQRHLMGEVSEYWQEHYDFGKQSKKIQQGMGRSSAQLLIMNGIAPLLAAYGSERGDEQYLERAVRHLEALPPENNKIIRKWHSVDFYPKSALDSQGMIEWFNEFCLPRKCLHCPIGVEIVQNKQL